MRLTTVLFIAGLMQVSALTLAQKITLKEKGAPLEQVFDHIRQQSGYDFLYNRNLMKKAKPINIDLKNATIEEILKECFEGQPFTYSLQEKTIVVKEKEPTFLERVAATLRNIDIRSRIVDDKGNALPGASVRVKGTNKVTITDENGEFTLKNVEEDAVILISYLGFKVKEMSAKEVNSSSAIKMELVAGELSEVNVELNTGYQTLNKERATGSFVHIDNKLLNRSFSTDILSRLDGVTSGVIFNKNGLGESGGTPKISIRGRSTINSNTEPLIILDNFPYEGDLKNINPNDIESVTILKDAAAASIWGVRAGNGVIVVNSKKGKYGQPLKVSLTSNLSVSGKPDLYAAPQLKPSDYIDVETRLFNLGQYDFYLKYLPTSVQSPVIDILDKQKRKLITEDQAKAQLGVLRGIDTREDYIKYFLQTAVNQQYQINLSGGGNKQQYYISGGFDQNRSNEIGDGDYTKLNLNASNTFRLLNDKLSLSAEILLSKSKTRRDLDPYRLNVPLVFGGMPYARLADESGNPQVIYKGYRHEFKTEAANKLQSDWDYRPLEELGNKGSNTDITDYRINLGLNYKILEGLNAEVLYQYVDGKSESKQQYKKDSYYVRDLVNRFSQIDPLTGKVLRIIPYGDVVSGGVSGFTGHSGRGQLNYNGNFGEKHRFDALAGIEIRDYSSSSKGFPTLYGYRPETGSYTIVDYLKDYPSFFGDFERILGGQTSISETSDRFFSLYGNAAYTYDGKYTVSGSVRKDESNLFGVDANKKGVPLWHVGLSWNIAKESFYHFRFLPVLRLRATYGYNGNLNKTLSAYVTAFSYGNNQYNAPVLEIRNPPNPMLGWEKVSNSNLAIDFALKGNVMSGSVEVFRKKGTDLFGVSPLSLQTGVLQFTGNNASVLTKGIDLTLNSINLNGKLKWETNFLMSHVQDRVTDYKIQVKGNRERAGNGSPSLEIGKPYAAMFSYKWAGLDKTGRPQGYLNGQVSSDYAGIATINDISQLVYHGSAIPTTFGSLKNNFTYQNFDLSFNVVYKLGYYFRRASYSDFGIDNYNYQSADDYAKRWQKPGDELITNVPAEVYPDKGESSFYKATEALVEKGDHIRLHDLQFGYTLSKDKFKGLPFNNLRFNLNVSNLNLILWRANRLRLDPDYFSYGVIPAPKTWSFGLTVNL